MMAKQKTYIAIDLKSFYASVECKERNRDPLTTNLVVADKSRTEKTICLAVSPSLKSYGIPGRPRLFEVVQKVKEANNTRRWKALNRTFKGEKSTYADALWIDTVLPISQIERYIEKSGVAEPSNISFVGDSDECGNYKVWIIAQEENNPHIIELTDRKKIDHMIILYWD